MKKIFLFTLVVFSFVFLSGCAQPETGTLVLQLTDAPSELNIEKALVTISEVKVHAAGNEVVDNNTTSNNTSLKAGWHTIVNEAQTFDLIEIKDVKTLLGQEVLPVGKYTQVRLSVDQALVTIDGVEHNLMVPSEKIKLTKGFNIVGGQTTTLTLDFDAQESIHTTGKDKYILNPTIKIIEE